MILSIGLNFLVSHYQHSKFQQLEYELHVQLYYNTDSSLDLYLDTGYGFQQNNRIKVKVNRGVNHIKIPFTLLKGEQLKFIRLDFGENTKLSKVKIYEIQLLESSEVLFSFSSLQISDKIGFSKNISPIDQDNGIFYLETSATPFDPYIVFVSSYDLMIPKWQRVFLLVLPWVVLMFMPVYEWIKEKVKLGDFKMLLVGLFISVILLKAAWITMASLLLLLLGIITLIKDNKIYYTKTNCLLVFLFIIPFVLLGQGQSIKLAIPIAFLIFSVISSAIDFSDSLIEIKTIFIKVFMVFNSILISYSVLFFCYDGFYYNIDFLNFFLNLKSNSHHLLYWVFYDHTTFISFFMLIGQIFIFDLGKNKLVFRSDLIFYSLLTLIGLLLLGSRFAFALGVMITLLNFISKGILELILIPLYLLIFGFIHVVIQKIDPFRANLWEMSILKAKENLWVGHGTGTSNLLLPEQLPIIKSGVSVPMPINHSHNQFLTFLLENGVIGVLLAILVLLLLFNEFRKHENKTMLLIWFAFITLMIIESPFKTARPLYVVSFLFAVFSSNSKHRKVDFNPKKLMRFSNPLN